TNVNEKNDSVSNMHEHVVIVPPSDAVSPPLVGKRQSQSIEQIDVIHSALGHAVDANPKGSAQVLQVLEQQQQQQQQQQIHINIVPLSPSISAFAEKSAPYPHLHVDVLHPLDTANGNGNDNDNGNANETSSILHEATISPTVDNNGNTSTRLLNEPKDETKDHMAGRRTSQLKNKKRQTKEESTIRQNQKVPIRTLHFDWQGLGHSRSNHDSNSIIIFVLFAKFGNKQKLAPIYFVFASDTSEDGMYAEADAFYCFNNIMSHLNDRFIAEADNSQFGIIAVVNEFSDLLHLVDPPLWLALHNQSLDPRFYALRWLMLLMAMEFQLPDVLPITKKKKKKFAFLKMYTYSKHTYHIYSFIYNFIVLSDQNHFEFVTYFAVAMMQNVRQELLEGNFASNLQLLQSYPIVDPFELLKPAVDLRNKFPMQTRKKSLSMRFNKAKNFLQVHKPGLLHVRNERSPSRKHTHQSTTSQTTASKRLKFPWTQKKD
ncbi:hypothetical protein RFI_05732, partial [Reticulomyxa filosa]